ncbi:MAG TPA: TonB-dependent receptor [Vicinamibacterales bacterium]
MAVESKSWRGWPQRAACLLLAAVAAIVVPGLAAAQSTLGTIRGTVTDPQKKVVAGAAVIVTDSDTGVPRVTETNEFGDYEVPNLRAGNYIVEVNAPGLQPFRAEGLVLRAGDTLRVDASLQIAGAREEVTVTAPTPSIQLESQAITGGLDSRQLVELPRTSRDFQDFLFLSPNVVGDSVDGGFQFLGGRTYGAAFIQDGQRSTGAIFGDIGNAAPGIDSIAEVKVLANSYSAEYGGLAGVVVTTRRGTGAYHGSAFYDFNGNELNARTFTQTRAGLERSDPVLDTSRNRWGGTFGGPIIRNRTFFFAAYDGSRDRSAGFSDFATVPTERMRAGDFSEANFVIRDPLTGEPFPGNVIPADRIHPASREVMNFFYPIPNQTPLANGFGRFRSPINPETDRQRYDIRIDHELSSQSSVFARYSWQSREPLTTLENPAFPALGFQDRTVKGQTLATSWTQIFSSNRLNELRVGFNLDRSNRRSRFNAGQMADRFGLEIPAEGRDRLGYPAFEFQGANSPTRIRDLRQNTLRDIKTDSFSIADSFTWLAGRHSLKMGGVFSRNHILDGFSAGANEGSGQFLFNGSFTGNSFADFLLGMPFRSTAQINTRGGRPLEATADEFAAFVQDDWKVNNALTLFLGVRYEILGNFREKNDLLINFDPVTASLVLPRAEIFDYLAPGAKATVPTVVADQIDLPRSLVRTDMNNVSPRVGFAYRVGEDNRTVIRGGIGLFYPTQAAQGIRDALSRSPFRYSITRNNPEYTRAFSTGSLVTSPSFGVNGVDFDLESAEVLQYNVTLEREIGWGLGARATYMGSRMDKLLVNRDINTVPPSTTPFDPDDPSQLDRLPYPNLGTFLNVVENAGEGTFHAMQLELRRPYRAGLQFEVAYTLAYSDSNAPDLGNSSLGVIQYDPYNIEADRGPDPNIPRHRLVANAIWEVPVGRGRSYGSSMPAWADALAGGWTLSAIFQARSGHFLTPYFAYGTDPIFPANTGKAYDTINAFGEAWKPDVVGDPKGAREPNSWFNLDAFRLPAPGTVGNARRGIIVGPGTWVVNLGIYKDVIRREGFRAEFRATLDNAFNHPQFLVSPQSSMLDITDFLINGLRENGTMNTVNEISSAENFALGRQITLGMRITF